MATRTKPSDEGGPEEGDGKDKPATLADLEKHKEEITRLLDDWGAQQSKRGSGDKGGRQTDREVENEARESVEEAFARLRAKEEHDAHHAHLKEQAEKAAQRDSERARRQPPVETGRTRNRLWDY